MPVRLRRLGLMGAALIGAAAPSLALDERVLPPVERNVVSASGRFMLRLETRDGWRTPAAQATLLDRGKPRWSRTLPHEMGPRTAAVADGGTVVLLDEWINIASRRAVTVISPRGETVAEHRAQEVFAALGVPPRDITRAATIGPWRSGEARIEKGLLVVPAGGRRLTVSLESGALGVRR